MGKQPHINMGVEYSEEELLKMKKKDVIDRMPEQVQRFCEYFIVNQNAKISAIKAGFEPNSAQQHGYQLKSNKQVQLYVAWMKARILRNQMLQAGDILDELVRIAFSDITDFIDVYPHSLALKPAEVMDGQLVKSIKSGRDGIQIELYDKMRALDTLTKYVKDMPLDWKQKLEQRKLELQEEELALKKQVAEKVDLYNPGEGDGFLEALESKGKEIWES